MSKLPALTKARLKVLDGPPRLKGKELEVHFNPASLQLTLSNELQDNNRNGPKQYIAKATAKLRMELIFDTTDTGVSVISITALLQSLVVPPNFTAPSRQHPSQTPPPKVEFEWGAIVFQGVAEAYQETIDFFSPEGVPLRATVSLTLSQQDKVFAESKVKKVADRGDFAVTTQRWSPDEVAKKAGNPEAARGVAAANGAESLRAPFAGELAVGDTVSLGGPIAFASFGASAGGALGVELGGGFSAGAGLSVGGGLSAGAGLSLGGGFSAGAGVSLGAGISAGAGVSLGVGVSGGAGFSAGFGVGGSASVTGLAGLSATEGAFAGLRTVASANVSLPRVDVQAFSATTSASASLATDAGATFRVGGQANLEGPSGLRANVGASGSFNASLRFD